MPAETRKAPAFRHILVPTDGSPASQRAATAAMALAKATGGRVTGFFAAPPATPIVFGKFLPTGYMEPHVHAAMIKRMSDKYLGKLASLAKAARVPFEGVRAGGYVFQIEMTYRASRLGARVVEVPITFRDRRAGQSKMSRRIIVEALLVVLSLRWDELRGRGPRRPVR